MLEYEAMRPLFGLLEIKKNNGLIILVGQW
jgi:hypothetical protein